MAQKLEETNGKLAASEFGNKQSKEEVVMYPSLSHNDIP